MIKPSPVEHLTRASFFLKVFNSRYL